MIMPVGKTFVVLPRIRHTSSELNNVGQMPLTGKIVITAILLPFIIAITLMLVSQIRGLIQHKDMDEIIPTCIVCSMWLTSLALLWVVWFI